MADYPEVGEEVILASAENGDRIQVQLAHTEQPIENPSVKRPRVKTGKGIPEGMTVELPLGKYEDLRVRIALVRPEDYGKHEAVIISSSRDVYRIMKSTAGLTAESVYVMLLNTRNRVLGVHEISLGGISKTLLEPVNVFQAAMIANASAIVIVHNHPSGDAEPSPEDVRMAAQIKEMADKLGISLLDSVIIGSGSYVSLADRGQIR
jgi:DNA repair protein RadC